MKIAFISPFLFRCMRGIERYSVDLACALARLGAEIHLLTWEGPLPWAWGNLPPGVKVHKAPASRYFQSLVAVPCYASFLRRIRPDVVNIYFTWHGEEHLRGCFRTLGMPLNMILHFPAEQTPHRYDELRKSALFASVSKVVAVSQYVKDEMLRALDKPSMVIPNGVDAVKFSPAANKAILKRRFRLNENAFVLATVAALEERKGIHKVLKALPSVLPGCRQLVYLVAGEGPEKIKLQKMAVELGVAEHVRFLGNADAVSVYQAADVFMFISHGEATGLAMLEAMACGLPVVAAKKRPFDEFASTRGTLWIETEDAAEIAGAIDFLFRNAATAADMGKENRAVILDRFTWDLAAKSYLSLFESQCVNK